MTLTDFHSSSEMDPVKRNFFAAVVIVISGLLPALLMQISTREPVTRNIHVRSFRYGKDPSVIRCNRGDTLRITFSTDDTGHSFFLEEFDTDAKVSPSKYEVEIFSPGNPEKPPLIAGELTLVARHPGILNYVVSKSSYRCHVWCGPMHAFEQGKLIIFPNTLLAFSIGSLAGIVVLWLLRMLREEVELKEKPSKDLLGSSSGFLRKMAVSRWPQIVATIITIVMIYIVIMVTFFGTRVSGRNLGVLLMWAVWLFLLVAVLTPGGGRIWCTVCPLPLIGDRLQRGSFLSPVAGKTGGYNNHFNGFSLKWPEYLNNNWMRLTTFLILATFSTTLVASPRVSGIAVLVLILLPTIMALIWELRAFCRYVCPVSVFITPFSEVNPVGLRSRSEAVCTQCRAHYCSKGNSNGWACPYGLNVKEIDRNADCGLCLECLRSCTYNNVSLFSKPFGDTRILRNMSEAWMAVAVFTTSIFYSILYLGHWPEIRDYVNIIDKDNWQLFGIYTLVSWSAVLIIMPGILYLLSMAGKCFSGSNRTSREIFLMYTGSLMPLGLMLWMAFVIPMLFVNVTFIGQSLSDPFGWGWDFLGTANIPWHQFLPQYIPWFQALLVLAGLHLSLKSVRKMSVAFSDTGKKLLMISLPAAFFLVTAATGMIVFFTN